MAHCGKETMRGSCTTSNESKWILENGGGHFRGPLISGSVRAEQLSGLCGSVSRYWSPFKCGKGVLYDAPYRAISCKISQFH